MKIFRKVINIIVDVLIVIILIVSAFVLAMSLTSKDTGAPNVFGYTLNAIQTGSMEPEFYEGDLLIGKITPDDQVFEEGDIVFFQSTYTGDDGLEYDMVKCHRIVEVKDEDGVTYYLTKGDNNSVSDEDTDGYITANTIIGEYETSSYQGLKLEGVGTFFSYIRTQLGFFLCVLLPMIIFFIYEAVRVVINIVAYNKEKAVEHAQAILDNSALTEEQKQKAIEEYLALQNGESPPDDNKSPDENSEDSAESDESTSEQQDEG